ncbi:MAG: hypothetical protein OT477_10140 [Chloroflexi bacterium]|nr:hypothetical protein [Chloroflexota bacterium]
MSNDIQKVIELCQSKLDLTAVVQMDEYGYASLPLCVIDTVFSIGARYSSTENTVNRFCQYVGLEPTNFMPLSDMLRLYEEHGIEGMANDVYQNRQRTSTRNGILKSEAVLRFSQVLHQFGVNSRENVGIVLGNPAFEAAIQEIPGQRSGISLRYFYMQVGSEKHIKPDRMIIRFIESAIGRTPTIEESHDILVGACALLTEKHPSLTPRRVDNLIWQYQRQVK